MQTGKKRFDYKFVIIGACFVMVLVCLGFCSSNKSLYLAAITEALGIKRGLFSVNDTCRYVTNSIATLFFGRLLQRFGVRKLIGAGFLCLMISTALYATANSIYLFWLGGCFLGLGLSWTTTTMVGCVVRRWCKEKAGVVMGFVLCANGIGGAIAAQIVSPIIYEEGNPFGYRNAYYLVIGILAVVGVLVTALMRDKPAAPSESEKKRSKRGAHWQGIPAETAYRKKYFYLTLVAIFLSGLMLQSITGVSAACMKDFGLDAGYVATVLSIHSLALAAFKFLTGLMYDKFGLRKTMIVCDVAAILVNIALGLVTASPLGMVLAMFYGVFSSLALPLETIMIPLTVNDFFGDHSYDKLLGVCVSTCTAGMALGSPLVNSMFDLIGTYRPMLFIFAGIMAVVAILFQYLITAAEKTRAEVENA